MFASEWKRGNERPFQCEICTIRSNGPVTGRHLQIKKNTNAIFVISSLHVDASVHMGQRNYKCDVTCNKTFIQSSRLNKHKVTHEMNDH